jgi:hypothetical protein
MMTVAPMSEQTSTVQSAAQRMREAASTRCCYPHTTLRGSSKKHARTTPTPSSISLGTVAG